MSATEYKVVGRNCLADFMGFDPHAAASMAEIMASAGEFAGACEDEGFGAGGGQSPYRSIGYYLPFVAMAIRKLGWLSKGKAWELYGSTEGATSEVAMQAMLESERKATEPKPEEKDYAAAAAALTYLNEKFEGMDEAQIAGLSDYEHNLRVAFMGGVMQPKTAGIIASGLNFAARDQEKKAERVDFSKSVYVGELGKRAIFTGLKCVFPTQGMGRPVVFVDAAGNKVTAWNPGFVCEKDGVYTVKATPVKQEEYKGLKSTMLNRMVLATEKDLAPKKARKTKKVETVMEQFDNADAHSALVAEAIKWEASHG